MAYEKLNLPDGTVLNAEHLEHIENGIDSAYTTAVNAKTKAENSGGVGKPELCYANGEDSHSEGYYCRANGDYSHAENYCCVADGLAAHAEGYLTKATGRNQHVQGKHNVEDTSDKYAHIVGNGASKNEPSNAHTLDWSGVPWFAGDRVILGGTGMDDENAVVLMPFYIAQTLTDEQKAQARANIDCGSVGATSACSATGTNAHAEGTNTSASGMCSHAEGLGTIAASNYQHAQGRWNALDGENKYAHIVGGGSNIQLRYNIHTLNWSGVPWFKGTKIMLGGTHQDDGNAVALMPPLVVKIGEETPSGSGIFPADKTAAEIYEAYTAGRVVFAVDAWNSIYPLELCDEANALFSRVIAGSGDGVTFAYLMVSIDADGVAAFDEVFGYCLPEVTAEDNGKTLKVVDGQWALV